MHAAEKSIYSNRTVGAISWIDLPTALLEYIDLVLQNKACPYNSVNFCFFNHGTTQLYNIYLYDIIVINTSTHVITMIIFNIW